MESNQEFIFTKHIDETNVENNVPNDEVATDPTADTFENILTFVIEEERRLNYEQQKNSILIPDTTKKTPSMFSIDQIAFKFLSEGSSTNSTMTFKEYVSNKREIKGINAVLNQSSQFISYVKMNEEITDIKLMNAYDSVLAVCEKTPKIFNNYFNILRDQGLKPSTILIQINSLLHLIDWVRMTSNIHFTILTEARQRLELERKYSTTMASRLNKLKTVDKLLLAREWVEDGIIGVQRMMKDSWPYFDALIRLSFHHRLSCHQYSWCVGYALASLWVFAVNARSQSIQLMTLKSWKEISTFQFSLSNQFKTSSTYQYQIISSTDILKLYVTYIRKTAIPPELDSDDAVLFPTYKGTPLSSGEASKKVEKIFRTYGYHLTITTLRDMISTRIEDMFQSRELTSEGKFIFFILSSNILKNIVILS
jgi:hypothetical protein